MKKGQSIFFAKHKWNSPLGRPRHGCDYNIKKASQLYRMGMRRGFYRHEIRSIIGYYACGDTPSGNLNEG